MSKSEWGTPAPQQAPKWEWRYVGEPATSRRERIATAALQGLASDPDLVDPERVAELAVRLADALIAELDKEQKG